MKTLQFRKNSWHFWLATTLGPMNKYRSVTDFCTYVRAVILGLLFAIVLLAIGLVCLYCIGDFLGFVAAGIMTGYWLMPEPRPALVVIFVLASAALIAGVIGCFVAHDRLKIKWRQRKYSKMVRDEHGYVIEPEPNFIASAYQSFKEKTCWRVNIE